MDWTQFGTNSVWLVVLGSLAYFLGKSVIRTLLAADLQAHKASLDRELEEFKSDSVGRRNSNCSGSAPKTRSGRSSTTPPFVGC